MPRPGPPGAVPDAVITRLQLKNFQSHELLRATLGRITTFVGRTDAGKSAVVRALRWLCFNRPPGDAHKRWGTGGVVVTAKVDGHTINRARAPGVSAYGLGNTEYNAVGAGVPTPIADLLNVDDINFQYQHDPPFWLNLSPGDLAKRLNAIVNLQEIDITLANLDRDKRRAATNVELTEARLAAAEERHKELNYVDGVDRALGNVVARHSDAVDYRARATTARRAAILATGAHQRANAARGAATAVSGALPNPGAAIKARAAAERARGYVHTAKRQARRAGGTLPDPTPLEDMGLQAVAAGMRHKVLVDFIQEAKAWQQKNTAARKSLLSVRSKRGALTRGQNCPVCGTVLK